MGTAKTLAVLIVITAGAVAGAYLTQSGTDEIPLSGKPLVPGIINSIGDVSSVDITGSGKTFRVEQREGLWVMPDRNDYVASAQKVQQLLVGLSELVRVEPKTSKPHLYPKLGLGDPATAGEDDEMIRYVLKGQNENILVSLTVGNRQDAKGNPSLYEYYVLKDDSPQAWLVQGRMPVDRDFKDWIDTEIIGLEPERVASTTIEHPGGATVTVTRAHPHARDFTLVDQPEGTTITEKWQVEDIGRGIARAEFEDVSKVKLEELEGEPGIKATMLTHDGLRVVMTTVTLPRTEEELRADGDLSPRLMATFTASFDEGAVNAALLEKKQANEGKDLDAMERGPARAEAEALNKLETAAVVKQEVEALNKRWTGWVYELPNFKAAHLLRKMDDLVAVEEKAPPPAASPIPLVPPALPAPPAPPGSNN